jgi:hypothetical protein
MAEHNAEYFRKALQQLDWSHPYTGQQLINLFSNFPVGWFEKVPPEKTYTGWQEFWQDLIPLAASTRGPKAGGNPGAIDEAAAINETGHPGASQ